MGDLPSRKRRAALWGKKRGGLRSLLQRTLAKKALEKPSHGRDAVTGRTLVKPFGRGGVRLFGSYGAGEFSGSGTPTRP